MNIARKKLKFEIPDVKMRNENPFGLTSSKPNYLVY